MGQNAEFSWRKIVSKTKTAKLASQNLKAAEVEYLWIKLKKKKKRGLISKIQCIIAVKSLPQEEEK